MDVSLSELRELVMDKEAWVLWFLGSQRAGHDWATKVNWNGDIMIIFPLKLKTEARMLILIILIQQEIERPCQ